MEFELEANNLRTKLYDLKNNRHPDYHKYLNLLSIEHFLIHFEKIKPDSKKIFILQNLNNFIDASQEILTPSLDEYLELYKLFIIPVGRIYQAKADFSFVTRPKYYIMYGVIGIVVLIILKLPLWANIVAGISMALTAYFNLKVYKGNKGWGVSY